jgi:hypothetical protein
VLLSGDRAAGDGIAAAAADADGALSADEVLAVLRLESAIASERRVLRRVAAALAVGLVLAVAAVGGLTYGVVAASKDTASSGGALVDKATGAPLATGVARGGRTCRGSGAALTTRRSRA